MSKEPPALQEFPSGPHDNPQKHGKVPKYFGQKEEKRIERGHPEHGPKPSRHDNDHGVIYPLGGKPLPKGSTVGVSKESKSTTD